MRPPASPRSTFAERTVDLDAFTSKVFARGWRRFVAWADGMLPEAHLRGARERMARESAQAAE